MSARELASFAMVLLSLSMVTVGALGLSGSITEPSLAIAGCFVVAVGLAFSLGRQSTRVG